MQADAIAREKHRNNGRCQERRCVRLLSYQRRTDVATHHKINHLNMVVTTSAIADRSANIDRTQSVPSHEGPNVLPNNPLFSRLLRHAHRHRVAIKDKELGVSRTYGELLDAMLGFREAVRAALPSMAKRRLSRGEEVYVGVLAGGGYEFTVAVLAVLALGAAVVPICAYIPPCDLLTDRGLTD